MMFLFFLFLFGPLQVDVASPTFSIATTTPVDIQRHDCPCTITADQQHLLFTCTTVSVCNVTLASKQNNVLLTYTMTVKNNEDIQQTPHYASFSLKTILLGALVSLLCIIACVRKKEQIKKQINLIVCKVRP